MSTSRRSSVTQPSRLRLRCSRTWCCCMPPAACAAAADRGRGGLRGATGIKVAGEVRASGTLKDEIAGGEQRRGLCLRQHGASAGAGDAGQERPGRAVRAQPAVRAGAAGLAVDTGNAARSHARSERQARHLDAARRSLRRLRLRNLPRADGVASGAPGTTLKKQGDATRVGNPISEQRRPGLSVYGCASRRMAHVDICRLTSAPSHWARARQSRQQIVASARRAAVGADYGMTVMNGSRRIGLSLRASSSFPLMDSKYWRETRIFSAARHAEWRT